MSFPTVKKAVDNLPGITTLLKSITHTHHPTPRPKICFSVVYAC